MKKSLFKLTCSSLGILYLLGMVACQGPGGAGGPSLLSAKSLPSKLQNSQGQAVRLDDGTPSLIAIVRQEDANVARDCGKIISDKQFATGQVRSITVLNFQNALPAAFQSITAAQIAADLKATANRLRPMYRREGSAADPMEHLHVVADFDGSVSRSLGATDGRPLIILVDGNGKTVERWDSPPSEQEFQKLIAD